MLLDDLALFLVLVLSCFGGAAWGAWYWRLCYLRGSYWDARSGHLFRATDAFGFWMKMVFTGALVLLLAGLGVFSIFHAREFFRDPQAVLQQKYSVMP